MPVLTLFVKALKKFYKYVSYTLGALFFLVLILFAVMKEEEKTTPEKSVLTVDFSIPVYETRPNDFLSSLTFGEAPTFNDILQTLQVAAQDENIAAFHAVLPETNLSLAQIQELREAVKEFKKSGKKTYAYASSFGQMEGGLRAYYLATAFDEIWLQPTGEMGITGFGINSFFFKKTLEKIGIDAEFSSRYEYKTGADSLTRDSMSEFERAEINGLLESFLDTVVKDIAADRKIDEKTLRDILLAGPYFADEALEKKLIDHTGYASDLENKIGESAKNPLDFYEYASTLRKQPQTSVLAYIPFSGIITDGTPLFGGDAYSSIFNVQDAISLLHETARDEKVAGIVLRIDSPGGAYGPSDALWHEISTVRKKYNKPIVCSMGSTAASGGYFLSLACDKVFALPASVTGSIGVYGGRLNAGKLLEKLGIQNESVALGKNTGFFAMHRPMTPSQKEYFEKSLDRVYKDFTEKTAQRRGFDARQLDKVARGRVFTGIQAKENNLIDAIGGISAARKEASVLAGAKDTLPLVEYPLAKTRLELLGEWMATGTVRMKNLSATTAQILAKIRTVTQTASSDNSLLFVP